MRRVAAAEHSCGGSIVDRKTAEQVVMVVNRCIDEMIATLDLVEKGAPQVEYEKYKRAVGRVINTFDMHVIDLVASEFPDLKPQSDN
jgi:hypothetical protein